jgi:hypothetical protein
MTLPFLIQQRGNVMQNLVRVSKMKVLSFKLPFEPTTFYKWFHLKKHPEIFVKLSGALFVDLDRLEQLIEASRGQRKAP